MKVSSINKNQCKFGKMYICDKNLQERANNNLFDLSQKLFVNTDAIDALDKRGVDIYVYSNSKDGGKTSKIAFTDKERNVYELPGNKFSFIFNGNTYSVISIVDSFLQNKIKNKSADNPVKTEIENIFNKKNENNIIIIG